MGSDSLTPKHTAENWARAKAAMLCNSVRLSTVCTQLSPAMWTLLRRDALYCNGPSPVAFCEEDRHPSIASLEKLNLEQHMAFLLLKLLHVEEFWLIRLV